MPDMRYAAGMDGGGTKTVLEARAPDGRVLLRERFGPLNLNSAAAQAVRETMQGCTDALARLPGGLEACAALCVGSAGVSNPQARALLEQMLRRCGYRGALLLTGDQETALAGALGAPCGMVLIGMKPDAADCMVRLRIMNIWRGCFAVMECIRENNF